MAPRASTRDESGSGSELESSDAEGGALKMPPGQILRHEIDEGSDALHRPIGGLFLSGLSAGLDVGFSLFLMAVMTTQAKGVLPEPVVRLLVGVMYSIGFVFVVLGRSELFTEQTTLAVLPVLGGRASVRQLLRLWAVVYVSNLLGAAAFAGIAAWTGPGLGVIEPSAFGDIAHRMTDHPAGPMFASAILAGWLMGLLSWLVAAVRDTISQVVIVGLVTTAIGFAGLHHSVLGTVEVLSGAFAGQGIGLTDVGHFLLWTTLGNAVGGTVFVGVIKYGIARPEAKAT
jgi:formate/nitrite transporter FocA (FNT family)